MKSTAKKAVKLSKQKKRRIKQLPLIQTHKSKPKNVSVSKESNVDINQSKKFINRKNRTLKERMEFKLKSAKFRILNERFYTSEENEVKYTFESKEEFNDYHEGFRQQVEQWPINPVTVIINSIRKYVEKKGNVCIADFGCGEAEIGKTFTNCTVHSFDLYPTNELVTACDMAKTNLKGGTVDIAVFCLSLMGSSNSRYIKEANRVLKMGGVLKIADVESRFDDLNRFIDEVTKHGFNLSSQNLSHNVFIFFNFQKVSDIGKRRKKNLPDVVLQPCLYKKR